MTQPIPEGDNSADNSADNGYLDSGYLDNGYPDKGYPDSGYVHTHGSPLEQSESLDSDGLGSTDRGFDPLDDGWDPPDRFGPGERFGTTAQEQRAGESLDSLLAQEQPEPDPYDEAARLESGEVLEFDVYSSAGGYSSAEDAVERPTALDGDGEPDDAPTLLTDDEGVRTVTTAELVVRGPVGGRARGRDGARPAGAPEEDAVHIRTTE
ncbi:hypothetical protein [Protofrankia coriariae]|uniref:hypothetical protein n=1 Tax=Protofrankia coriariae TaxID=1562887 RepID=UPI00069B3CAC|nr:hypothetical protein [Protofrankia coriariae]